MSPLFGNRDDEEKIKNLVEGAQKLSDQIVALQKQVNEKNTQLENLQKAQSQNSSQTAADAVSREANALATGAVDHPYTATGVTLTVGLLAFAIGYVMGRSSVEPVQSYWR